MHSKEFSAIYGVASKYTDSVFYYAITKNGEREVTISKFKDGPPPPPDAYYIPKEYDNYPVSSYYYIDTSYPDIETSGDDWILVNDPSTEIGKMLYADGHPVAEIQVKNIYREGLDTPALRTDTFLFVLVQLDGNWYIAETKAVD